MLTIPVEHHQLAPAVRIVFLDDPSRGIRRAAIDGIARCEMGERCCAIVDCEGSFEGRPECGIVLRNSGHRWRGSHDLMCGYHSWPLACASFLSGGWAASLSPILAAYLV